MRPWNLRRIFALCLALSLALGMAWHGIPAGQLAPETVAIKMGVPASGDCSGCPDQHSQIKTTHEQCVATCTVQAAVLAGELEVGPIDALGHFAFAATGQLGQSIRPDPGRPRLVIPA